VPRIVILGAQPLFCLREIALESLGVNPAVRSDLSAHFTEHASVASSARRREESTSNVAHYASVSYPKQQVHADIRPEAVMYAISLTRLAASRSRQTD
jgi:hypothetical protein